MSEYWSQIAAFIAGLGTGVALKIAVDNSRRRSDTSNTKQSGNTVGGDQAGRDINK